jgi:hypothetical protein
MSDSLNRQAPVGSTRSTLALIRFLTACFAVAGLGSVITTAQTTPYGWYETLDNPSSIHQAGFSVQCGRSSTSSSPYRDGSCGARVGSPGLE